MHKTTRQLKQEAKQALAGKWPLAIAMTLVSGFIGVSLSYPTPNGIMITIFSLISTALSVILNVGLLSFLLKLCCGQKDQAAFKDLFYGFQCHPGKALLLYLLMILYLLPGTLIYAILVVVFLFTMLAGAGADIASIMYGSSLYFDPTAYIGFLGIFLLFTLLYVIYAVYINTTYGQVYYLLLDYPELPATEIWKRSKQLMKGNRWRMIKLQLSFVPILLLFAIAFACLSIIPALIIVGTILFFVATLWVGVHMNTALTAFYLDLVQIQAAKNYKAAANQYTTYTATDTISDTNLTHDCEAAHPETQDETNGNYRGIDPETFK